MTFEWSCAFCYKVIDDDSHSVEIGIAILPSQDPQQFFRAHYACIQGALHPEVASEIVDPLEDS